MERLAASLHPMKRGRSARTIFWIGVALFALFVAAMSPLALLGGCSKSSPATFTPAIASPIPLAAVLVSAIQWTQGDPEARFYATTADTHSMEPFFTSHSIPLCVRYTGQQVPNGTVAIFNRGDLPRVMHVISDQTADSVYMSGYHNHNSDGWFKKSAIEGIVVGQLYAP